MTVLVSGPLTVDEIVALVREQGNDGSSNPLWSDDQVKLALKQACIKAAGKFFLTDTYSLSFVEGTMDYTLPDYVKKIVLVRRDVTNTVVDTTINISDLDVTTFRHFYARSNNKLYFDRNYPTSTFTIFYERNVPIPFENRILGAAVTSSATALTLTDASPNIVRLDLPGYFRIDNEIVKVTAAASNTSVTISRGALGTTAASHVNGSIMGYIVMANMDTFYAYLLTEIGMLLNLWRVQQGNQVDVSANITAMRLFREDREEIAKNLAQPHKSRRMHFSRTRRRRRAW